MPQQRRFKQIDVFTQRPFKGNPLAVVLDADGLTDEQMQSIARWTHLSETTFVVPPTNPLADYGVRIFTPEQELPFAGHPTLGTAHALLESGLQTKSPGQIIQQSGIGLVPINIDDDGSLAFHVPPATIEPFDATLSPLLERTLGSARIDKRYSPATVRMGISWLIVRMDNADTCLNITPDAQSLADLQAACQTDGIAIYGPHDNASPTDYEVRTFYMEQGYLREDPVTGSANACLACILRQQHYPDNIAAQLDYQVRQGTKLQCDGRISVVYINDEPWVGGHSVTIIDGTLLA
ncbi:MULTISPECIES: PhzF family phenazine biosynthesis protein [unclassified Brenneria]|uniref:PhzF family phenazine biosynthesis protein n=1 Tax=unclassified Brenneria TaxID=2634434 RepID=UPI0029C4F1F1|nr:MULTISPECIES: PhzF family phenazine biosynthesis protein [unclassified Brenneria]MDX5629211.1 PhzF family phenazine biosynthesis protein [Brenneria sp. L3-3Z]MDX5696350.1 PhzF family phenazine biosynthesis protein [Brenneria sp. L4-2C]